MRAICSWAVPVATPVRAPHPISHKEGVREGQPGARTSEEAWPCWQREVHDEFRMKTTTNGTSRGERPLNSKRAAVETSDLLRVMVRAVVFAAPAASAHAGGLSCAWGAL